MEQSPNYIWSDRWKLMLNTAGRPDGYGRPEGLTKVIKMAALRGGQAKRSTPICD